MNEILKQALSKCYRIDTTLIQLELGGYVINAELYNFDDEVVYSVHSNASTFPTSAEDEALNRLAEHIDVIVNK